MIKKCMTIILSNHLIYVVKISELLMLLLKI